MMGAIKTTEEEMAIAALNKKIEDYKDSISELGMMKTYDWQTYLHPEAVDLELERLWLELEEIVKERDSLLQVYPKPFLRWFKAFS